MDKLTKEQRQKNMQAVKNKNSRIEILLGKALWSKGLRYRKNDKTVFGKPDFTFKNTKLQYFATVNFGMERIGKYINTTINPTKIFGYRKLNEISNVILR